MREYGFSLTRVLLYSRIFYAVLLRIEIHRFFDFIPRLTYYTPFNLQKSNFKYFPIVLKAKFVLRTPYNISILIKKTDFCWVLPPSDL